jgi:large subunit ribosomal protein L27
MKKTIIRYKLNLQYFASKSDAGKTSNNRDSQSKRLGIKRNHNQFIKQGGIIVRQRGTKYLPGKNIIIGSDWTFNAKISGIVKFRCVKKNRTEVSVISEKNNDFI